MQQPNGQFMVTMPRGIAIALQVKKGDKVEWIPNLKKGVVELVKVQNQEEKK